MGAPSAHRCSTRRALRAPRSAARNTALLVGIAALCGGQRGAERSARAERLIRIATLLPAGTSWMKEFGRFAQRVRAQSGNTLRIRYYPGAVMGDERDVVEKMARGRLEGGVLTAAGLGRIVPEIRALELPFLFRSAAELRRVRAQLQAGLDRAFESKGYKLIGWGDHGGLRLFSKQPIASIEQLRRAKCWAWVDDPLALAIVRRLGMRFVLLAAQAVLPSLQSGIIDTVYGSPYTTLALQWHTQLGWYSGFRFNYGIGAVLLTRHAFDELTPQQRQALARNARALEEQHVRRAQQDNRAALRLLKRMGFRRYAADARLRAHLEREAAALRQELAGKFYSAALLRRVVALRDALRAAKGPVR